MTVRASSEGRSAMAAPRSTWRSSRDRLELLRVARRPDTRREDRVDRPPDLTLDAQTAGAGPDQGIAPVDRARHVGDSLHEDIAAADVRQLVDQNEAAPLGGRSTAVRDPIVGRRSPMTAGVELSEVLTSTRRRARGNMIEAEDAFARMGADVMRWQYCAQPPDRNLLFGFGPRTRSSAGC